MHVHLAMACGWMLPWSFNAGQLFSRCRPGSGRGSPCPAAAASMYGPDAGKEILPGIRQVDLGKWPIDIGGADGGGHRLRLRPGSGFPDEAMKNDRSARSWRVEVWVKQGDKTYTAKAGHVFACAKDSVRGGQEPEQRDQVMRVIDLMPA